MKAIVFIKDYSNKKVGDRSSNFGLTLARQLIDLGVAVFEDEIKEPKKEVKTKPKKEV